MTGGFSGPVYAVHPAVTELEGVPCVPSAAALPEEVDLAVIATPAAAVVGIAEECGQRGVKALVVLAAGLSGAGRAELLSICRRHGMRMVGPASFGVADTSAGLDATFAARHPRPGSAGLALQSTGGAGFALAEHLSRIGIGISSLVSLGDTDDVAGDRHAAVVGVRPGDQAGPAVSGVDRGTRPSSPARPAASAAACRS